MPKVGCLEKVEEVLLFIIQPILIGVIKTLPCWLYFSFGYPPPTSQYSSYGAPLQSQMQSYSKPPPFPGQFNQLPGMFNRAYFKVPLNTLFIRILSVFIYPTFKANVSKEL